MFREITESKDKNNNDKMEITYKENTKVLYFDRVTSNTPINRNIYRSSF